MAPSFVKKITSLNKNPLGLPLMVASVALVVLALMGGVFLYLSNKTVEESISISGQPEFLYSIPANKTVNKESRLKSPLAVTVKDKNLVVADSGHGYVKIFRTDGTYSYKLDLAYLKRQAEKAFWSRWLDYLMRLLKIKDREEGAKLTPLYPVGLAYADDGRIFVADVITKKVLVFVGKRKFLYLIPLNPKFLYSFPERAGKNVLIKPVGLWMRDDKIFVTDVGDSTVKIFNLKGQLLKKFGSVGTKPGQFFYPNGVAVGNDGTIYVADSNNRVVQAFDSNGKLKFVFNFPFSLPRGIAHDALDRVQVVDTFDERIYVFSKEGKSLFSYGSVGNPGERFSFPNGISIDSENGQVFIADRGNNRIQVWGYY